MAHIGIIGAGVAGLSAAWELIQQGHQVTIYEAGAEIGGLAAGFKDTGWDYTLEKFYHHWFESDADLLRLADEVGIRDKIVFPRPKTSFWENGKHYQLDSPISALLTPLMNPIEKIRFGFVTLYLRFTKNWQWLEQSTADEWLQRYYGKTLYEKMWRPLLIGKFSHLYNEVNMAWMWARLHSRTTRLGTYKGGFQQFLEDIAAKLKAKGVTIHLNCPVENIDRQADGTVQLRTKDDIQSYAAVISTTSPRLLLKLAPQIEGAYAKKVKALRSMGAVVIIVSLKQQLMTDNTYWLSLPAKTPDKHKNPFPFLALVEHTNYVDKKHFANQHIVYAGDYVEADHEYFQLSDDELADRFLATFQRVNPNFSKDWIINQWVFRAPYAQPLPTIKHSGNIPALRTSIQGIYWASMSQVYPWDRGTNYAVEIGRRVAREVMEDLA